MKGKYRGCDIEVERGGAEFLTFAVFDNAEYRIIVNNILIYRKVYRVILHPKGEAAYWWHSPKLMQAIWGYRPI